jgi:hypothetical protein
MSMPAREKQSSFPALMALALLSTVFDPLHLVVKGWLNLGGSNKFESADSV